MHNAQVIPAGRDDRYAKAECGECGWEGKNHRWFLDAQLDADRHNEKHNK